MRLCPLPWQRSNWFIPTANLKSNVSSPPSFSQSRGYYLLCPRYVKPPWYFVCLVPFIGKQGIKSGGRLYKTCKGNKRFDRTEPYQQKGEQRTQFRRGDISTLTPAPAPFLPSWFASANRTHQLGFTLYSIIYLPSWTARVWPTLLILYCTILRLFSLTICPTSSSLLMHLLQKSLVRASHLLDQRVQAPWPEVP